MAVKVSLDYLYENEHLSSYYKPIILKLQRDAPKRLPSEILVMNDILTRDELKNIYKSLTLLTTPIGDFSPIIVKSYVSDDTYLPTIDKIIMSVCKSNMFPLYMQNNKTLYFAVREGSELSASKQELESLMTIIGAKGIAAHTLLASDYDLYLEKFLIKNFIRMDFEDPYRRDVSILPEVYILKSILLHATDIYFDAVKAGFRYRYKVLNEQITGNTICLNETERMEFLRAIYILEHVPENRMEGEVKGDHFINYLGGIAKYSGRAQHLLQMAGLGVNIRVLDVTKSSRPLDKCGLSPRTLDKLELSLHNRNGSIVFSGPTGSGKSTLLASYIQAYKDAHPDLRLEEFGSPIEQVNEDHSQVPIGYRLTFDDAADASTRRNGDIIVTSESNTFNSAKWCIESASMDKISITTTHTPSAPFIPERFRQLTHKQSLFYDEFLMNIKVCTHQLMLKQTCPKCTKHVHLDNTYFSNAHVKMLKHYGFTESSEIPVVIEAKKSCSYCQGRGYLLESPIIIMEVILISNKLRKKMRGLDEPSKIIDLLEEELEKEGATELHDAFYYMSKDLLSFNHIWDKCNLINKIDDFIEDTDIVINPKEGGEDVEP